MMKNILVLALVALVNLTSYAQKTINDPVLENKLFKPYYNYFEKNREWVYTHLNKSAYITGDDIWFTSYILNPATKGLNFATSKLYVELWSPDQKMVSRKILYVNTGTTNHYIHLADSLLPGTYCFRAYTNWMRNFYQESDFNTLITILGSDNVLENGLKVKHAISSINAATQKDKNQKMVDNSDYDIQFLPESGHFLEGVDNVFGIKATDSYGRGVKISGELLNADSVELMSFSTNNLGMENFIIPEASNQQYYVKVTLPNGTTRNLKLPLAEPKGVIMHINPYRSDVVWFKIQTNEATLRLNKSYIVMVHANGEIFNNYRIDFSKGSAVQFKIEKKELGNGIIYATLFEENLTPIAERLFYNQDTIKKGKLTFNVEPLTNDTVKFNVKVSDSLNKPCFAKLSISVLPGGTALNHFNNSLRAESIFRPALKGSIENPNYYFENNNIDRTVALDNLLLTQGWRKYDWPTIVKDTLHEFRYPFEAAFTIEGSVKNWIKNKPELRSKITLLSPKNNIFLVAPVDSIGTFKFNRVYLADSTWIFASASSDKGKNWNRVLQISIPETMLGFPKFKQLIIPSDNSTEKYEDIPKLTKGVIRLKEVLITATKKNPFDDNVYISGISSKTFEITKDNYYQFMNVELLLLSRFNVKIIRKSDGGYHIDMGHGISSISGEGEPLMMIDNMRVSTPKEIIDFPVNLIEAIAVNKDGFGGGLAASHGTIAIKSRMTPLFDNTDDNTNVKRLLVNGYAAPKKYFDPKYIIQPGTTDYDKYATIYWEPNLVTDSTNSGSFRFFVPKEIKSVTIRTEGISLEGMVFLHEQKMILPERN
jgi:hypothetical protein